MSKKLNVALIGNPNTGKTSIFNVLTGLNQKVGNYPGITVDKKQGISKLANGEKIKIIDLPGTYSLTASSIDEQVVSDLLQNPSHNDFPDVAVVVAEVEQLKRNLLLFTQIKDLKIPTILVINMSDVMTLKGIELNIEYLEQQLHTKIALVSARENRGIDDLKTIIANYKKLPLIPCLNIDKNIIENDLSTIDLNRIKQREAAKRYQFINKVLAKGQTIDNTKTKDSRSKLDSILTHKVFGYVIFFFILLLIFQALYKWSEIPMEFIDSSFASLSEWIKNTLPKGIFTNLLAEGIISGIGGVVIFIPQIAFLFLFIAVLEESGYMSRVVFIMDNIMKRFGLSGKSVVPLISGTACAIPAIMAARNIESWKERLITILVTPFTTCAARLPVYLIIIALVIPEGTFLGFSYKALSLLGMYILGFLTALISAYILHKVLKVKSKSYFVVEMPSYKIPLLKNVLITVVEKTKTFVFEAGKIILAISVLLWVLASYGQGEQFNNAEHIITTKYADKTISEDELQQYIASYKLEHSYIGVLGKTIEPVIKPLGYDWKIGIGLIASFAAREVFVGTLATIYSVGSDDEDTIKNKMAAEKHANGLPVFTLASGISLLLFYAFAMQCMSTLAIVKRETNSWKWPLLQLITMTIVAYIAALIAFQILK